MASQAECPGIRSDCPTSGPRPVLRALGFATTTVGEGWHHWAFGTRIGGSRCIRSYAPERAEAGGGGLCHVLYLDRPHEGRRHGRGAGGVNGTPEIAGMPRTRPAARPATAGGPRSAPLSSSLACTRQHNVIDPEPLQSLRFGDRSSVLSCSVYTGPDILPESDESSPSSDGLSAHSPHFSMPSRLPTTGTIWQNRPTSRSSARPRSSASWVDSAGT